MPAGDHCLDHLHSPHHGNNRSLQHQTKGTCSAGFRQSLRFLDDACSYCCNYEWHLWLHSLRRQLSQLPQRISGGIMEYPARLPDNISIQYYPQLIPPTTEYTISPTFINWPIRERELANFCKIELYNPYNVRGASNYNKYFFLRVRENATL